MSGDAGGKDDYLLFDEKMYSMEQEKSSATNGASSTSIDRSSSLDSRKSVTEVSRALFHFLFATFRTPHDHSMHVLVCTLCAWH
jgi:hypothetical protein